MQEMRSKKGLPQEELANKCGTSKSYTKYIKICGINSLSLSMPKRTELPIKEELEEIQNRRKSESNQRLKARLYYLELRKENKIKNQEELARYLNVSADSLHRWSKKYNEGGINGLLSLKSGKQKRNFLPSKTHELLKEKLKNLESPFLSYTHAVNWLTKKTGIKYKYTTLRSYMIREFGSKLKVPRKSHYKKDPEAELVFKKPSKLT